MSTYIPNSRYLDTEYIAILKNEIAEIDHYTHTSPESHIQFDDFCGPFWIFYSKESLIRITHRLQYVISLEEELDEELRKPLDPFEENITRTEKNINKSAVVYQNNEIIKYLQDRISFMQDKISLHEDPSESLCFSRSVYSHHTNHMLIKQILEMRLRRELHKTPVSKFTYGSIAGPSTERNSSIDTKIQYRNEAIVELLRRKIAMLESNFHQTSKKRFTKEGNGAIVYANYYLAHYQYLKDELNTQLNKPSKYDTSA